MGYIAYSSLIPDIITFLGIENTIDNNTLLIIPTMILLIYLIDLLIRFFLNLFMKG